MNKYLRWILIFCASSILLFSAYWFYVIYTFLGFPEITYRKTDLIENYENKAKEINEVKRYVESITPKDRIVSLEFDGNKNFEIFHVIDKNGHNDNWNLTVNSKKTDTLLNKLNWTIENINTLKEKLDKANCISVNSKSPFTVGYQRSGMGMYFYRIFDKPLTDSIKAEYNDGCTFVFYKDNIVLEFGGGAIGQQCFEGYDYKTTKNN